MNSIRALVAMRIVSGAARPTIWHVLNRCTVISISCRTRAPFRSGLPLFCDPQARLLTLLSVEALCLTFCRAWRKLLEHLRDALVQVLFIFLGFVGQGVLSTAAPNQLLGFRFLNFNNQGSFLVSLLLVS